MTKTAFLTGISGQDGSYLSEHLLSLGYRVTGIVRRNSVPEHQSSRLDGLDVETVYGDVTDIWSLISALERFKPDEVYNLAAQSHVRISFDVQDVTIQTNGVGAWNVFEAVRRTCPGAKVYQASSSEMFGNSIDDDGYQRPNTSMSPVSPYGCAKLFAYCGVKHYRRAHGMFAVNGILFNHESPRRASNFVTSKVVKTAVQIKHGLATELRLGNLESKRDWGHSADYVRAMHLMLQHDKPREWIVATGETRSVRDLCEYVFRQLRMDYQDYVVQNQRYMRPEELKVLRGDSSGIRSELGWEPEYTFESMMDEIIEHWEEIIAQDRI